MEVAFYASQYTDRTIEVSIKDQIRSCHLRLERCPHEVVGIYSDTRETNSPKRRTGLLKLLEHAKAGHFDRVYVGDVERFALNEQNMAGILERLTQSNVMVCPGVWPSKCPSNTNISRALQHELVEETNGLYNLPQTSSLWSAKEPSLTNQAFVNNLLTCLKTQEAIEAEKESFYRMSMEWEARMDAEMGLIPPEILLGNLSQAEFPQAVKGNQGQNKGQHQANRQNRKVETQMEFNL